MSPNISHSDNIEQTIEHLSFQWIIFASWTFYTVMQSGLCEFPDWERLLTHTWSRISIFLASDVIPGNLLLSSCRLKVNRRRLLVFSASLDVTLQEHHQGPRRREKLHVLFNNCKVPKSVCRIPQKDARAVAQLFICTPMSSCGNCHRPEGTCAALLGTSVFGSKGPDVSAQLAHHCILTLPWSSFISSAASQTGSSALPFRAAPLMSSTPLKITRCAASDVAVLSSQTNEK